MWKGGKGMKIIYLDKTDILEFEKQHNLELIIYERASSTITKLNTSRFYCCFKGSEIKESTFLTGACGNGNTLEETIRDYCYQISGKTIVLNAMSDTNRIEIQVPELTYSRELIYKLKQ